MCRPQGYVFHNFCLGRVLFSAQQSGKRTFFMVSVWEGCCFQVQESGKGCVLILVWYWNSGKGCHFTFFFLRKVGKFCLGRVRVCHPGLHTPIYNLVKSLHLHLHHHPPPPTGQVAKLRIAAAGLPDLHHGAELQKMCSDDAEPN